MGSGIGFAQGPSSKARKAPLQPPTEQRGSPSASSHSRTRAAVTIHWEGVPLREAIERLHLVYDDPVFLDRRVDPSRKVNLGATVTSAASAIAMLAQGQDWSAANLGPLIYLGPRDSAARVHALAKSNAQVVARLRLQDRRLLDRKDSITWPRLTEPRGLVVDLVARTKWQLADSERIPHDVWAAGQLPEMGFAEQLTVLLAGFDLTFELQPRAHVLRIVPISPDGVASTAATTSSSTPSPARRAAARTPTRRGGGTKQVYTLRVQEKPVGAVLRELANKLHWSLEIDEAAIQAAGKSLDQRISFSVESADREQLLDALLTPAGLEYRIEGDRVRVVPSRY
ncbi:MAG: STN domain-containing protein [Pirellulales bacterium]|nr:STN domain-containing protein [Pirellulales bacterium]